jgi:hypothetical protein
MVKVLTLRRRQGAGSSSNSSARKQSQTSHNKQQQSDDDDDDDNNKESSPSNHETPESPSHLENSLRSSSQLGSSLRSSSQASTIHPSQSNEESDLELGNPPRRSSQKSLSAPTSVDTITSGAGPPSIVSWHASSSNQQPVPIAFMPPKEKSLVGVDSSQHKLQGLEPEPHPLENAIVLQPSDLTHTSTSTASQNHARAAFEARWGIPSDPRALPLYLMPLAVLPLICLVGGIMIVVLLGVVVASYV